LDFQSAVSQVSHLRTAEKANGMSMLPVCRLEVGLPAALRLAQAGDTAGRKPTLRRAASSEPDAALGVNGGAKTEENRQFEIPQNAWH